jgi:hypothetical protein
MTNYYKKQWPVDKTESWQNGKLIKWKLLKQQVGKNGKLIK